MPQEQSSFEMRTAHYFEQKARQAKGSEKLIVALEMSKYITSARMHGLSFDQLKQAGFKFATVPDLKN